MNLHKSTLCDFGQEYVKPIQDFEHTVKKLAQHRNYLHFNQLVCVYPKMRRERRLIRSLRKLNAHY